MTCIPYCGGTTLGPCCETYERQCFRPCGDCAPAGFGRCGWMGCAVGGYGCGPGRIYGSCYSCGPYTYGTGPRGYSCSSNCGYGDGPCFGPYSPVGPSSPGGYKVCY